MTRACKLHTKHDLTIACPDDTRLAELRLYNDREALTVLVIPDIPSPMMSAVIALQRAEMSRPVMEPSDSKLATRTHS